MGLNMCGIFGLIGNLIKQEQLDNCALLLNHRGPDSFSRYINQQEQVYLAHCRLSVIDLSSNASQPMANEDNSILLTYNGEIYNYTELREVLIKKGHIFKSNTDSEVIIHAYEQWGIECVHKFNGMFAFAIWDSVKRKIFIARDRLGIKPLYYALIGDRFVFSSEPKSIIELPIYKKNISYSGLFSYLKYRYISGSESIWNDICRLEPGHYLVFDQQKNNFIINQYWDIPLQTKSWKEDDALERFSELLDSSISMRLVSDVPLGVFLSGGYDSTAITYSAKKNINSLDTFSMGFEQHPLSELNDAALVSSILQTSHHEINIKEQELKLLDDIYYYYDEPFADSSLLSTYSLSQFTKKDVTVALSGDGGDELFGGYSWYTQMKDILTKNENIDNPFDIYNHLIYKTNFFINDLKRLFPDCEYEDFDMKKLNLYEKYYIEEIDFYKRWRYIDVKTFLVDDILLKVDRASMAHGLEVRVPFLDYRMVEFAFSLPDDLCIRENIKKFLMHKYLKNKMPDKILYKAKQGFGSKFRPSINTQIEQIKNGHITKMGVLDFNEFYKIANNNSILTWYVFLLEKWFSRWVV